MSEAEASTRAGAIARARQYVSGGDFERDLARRVAIRTESQMLPQSLPELVELCPRRDGAVVRETRFHLQDLRQPGPRQRTAAAGDTHRGPKTADRARLRPWRRHPWTRRRCGPRARDHGSPRATATSSMAAAPPTINASTPSTLAHWPPSWRNAAASWASTSNI